MKNIAIAVLAIICVVLGFMVNTNDNIIENLTLKNSGALPTPREFEGDVIAKADGKEIKEGEIRERLDFVTNGNAEKIELDKLEEDALKAIVTEIAVQRKVLQNAYNAGIQSDPELKKRVNSFLENVYKEKFLETIATENMSESKIKDVYEDLTSKAEGKLQYKVKHILVKEEDEANALKAKLKNNKFEDLAKQFSVDKLSAKKGGDLGYIFPQEFVVEFADTVKKLKKNEVSSPVKTKFGWHIVKLEDTKKAEIVPFDKAEPRIRKQLMAQNAQEYIQELSKDIVIEIVK